MAGKGDTIRSFDRFKKNFQRAFGKRRKLEPGQYVLRDGVLVPIHLADMTGLRLHDATNIRSVSTGVAPEQVPEMNARFGDLGVKFHPRTGDAIYKDRQAKLRVLKRRGFIDNDEVRG